jgi:hypothetical protein
MRLTSGQQDGVNAVSIFLTCAEEKFPRRRTVISRGCDQGAPFLPAAARLLWRDWRVNDGLGADVLGHKVGMLAKPITRPLDLDDDGVVKQAIEERGGDHWVAEHRRVLPSLIG